jgi:hypothetical protein
MTDPTALLNQHPVWTALVAATGVSAGIAKGFEWFDAALNDDSRFKLSLWLVNVPGDEQIDAWAMAFPNLIDRVFGPKALSLKFFARSCIASTIAVTLVGTVFCIHHKGYSWFLSQGGFEKPIENALTLGLAILAVNCIPDYFSVLITRFVVRLMSKRATALRVVSLLILDTLLTGSLAFLSVVVWAICVEVVFAGLVFGMHYTSIIGAIRKATDVSNLLGSDSVFQVLIVASFFTSIWVWLYVLSSVAIRILHKVRFVWDRIIRILDIEKKPMQAIGRVAGVMAGCGYLLLLGGVWLFRHL